MSRCHVFRAMKSTLVVSFFNLFFLGFNHMFLAGISASQSQCNKYKDGISGTVAFMVLCSLLVPLTRVPEAAWGSYLSGQIRSVVALNSSEILLFPCVCHPDAVGVACSQRLHLSWWALWFELICVVIAAGTTFLTRFRSAKLPALIWLAICTAVLMLATDTFNSSRSAFSGYAVLSTNTASFSYASNIFWHAHTSVHLLNIASAGLETFQVFRMNAFEKFYSSVRCLMWMSFSGQGWKPPRKGECGFRGISDAVTSEPGAGFPRWLQSRGWHFQLGVCWHRKKHGNGIACTRLNIDPAHSY